MTDAHATPPSTRRVLYIVSLFPCWSETFIVREIQQLLARGYDVRILSLRHPSERLVQSDAQALLSRVMWPRGPLRAAVSALRALAGSPLRSLHVLAAIVAGLWRQPVVLAKTLVAVWRAASVLDGVRAFDPWRIHAHWATYPSTVAWALSRLLGRPFSFTCHAHDIFVEDQMIGRKLADASLVATISEFNVRWLERWRSPGGRRAPVEVVHCGVDAEAIEPNYDRRAEAHIVGIGRLDPIKGFDVLVEALRRLDWRSLAFECTVVGEGPERGRLERMRDEAGLYSRLELPGAWPQERVQALLAQATIFVMPSVVARDGNRDGIPVALMEAMAGGAAVIGTQVSGLPELIEDEVSGLLVPPEDPEALAAAIARLLADPALRQRLGHAARERVLARFNIRSEAARLAGLLERRPAVLEAAHAR